MFKARLRGHMKSFNHEELRKDTELSKYVWVLKNEEKEYDIKWEILCSTKKYSPGRWYCSLCTAEKYHILMADEKHCPNNRSELVSKCRHKRKFLLKNS